MRQEISEAQRRVAEIAAGRHRLVTFEQLVSAGMSPSTISRRVREGWLHRRYRGIYVLGDGTLTREGKWLAAVLACGRGAVLSHESAAQLWGISPKSPSTIRVSVPATGGRARRRGIRVHYRPGLTSADVTIRRSIPVTTQARTLSDLGYGPERTRSNLERQFLGLCRAHGIPQPEVNVRLGPYEVDFLWRAERLIAEVDGYDYHSSRARFRSDRARDRELGRRGFTVMRFAGDELADEPVAMISSLRARLGLVSRTDPRPRSAQSTQE